MMRHIERGDILMLPAATVLETGNHIAQNGDGNQRRACATDLRDVVEQAIEGTPWQLVPLPENPGRFASLLTDFPDYAMRGRRTRRREHHRSMDGCVQPVPWPALPSGRSTST